MNYIGVANCTSSTHAEILPGEDTVSEHTIHEKAGICARTPEECGRMLLTALETGDIEASLALYESTAILFKKSGETVSGHDAIRAINAMLIALKPKFTIEFVKTTFSGDGTIATTRTKASLAGTGPDGRPVHSDIYTLEVLRLQADGGWRYLIDDPYGSMRASLSER